MDYQKEKEILQDMLSKGEIEPKKFEEKMSICDEKINEEREFLRNFLSILELKNKK